MPTCRYWCPRTMSARTSRRCYHSALQHLLDRVFAVLCESDPKRRARLQANLERIREKGSE